MNEEPLVRVLRGEPAPDELAALVAVLVARSATPPRGSASVWAASGRPWAGHRSWRASTLPRR